jgi:hypothetical protein
MGVRFWRFVRMRRMKSIRSIACAVRSLGMSDPLIRLRMMSGKALNPV